MTKGGERGGAEGVTMGERATELMPQTERRLQEWEGKGGEE